MTERFSELQAARTLSAMIVAGLSQVDIAGLVGLSQPTISRGLRGLPMGKKALACIAAAKPAYPERCSSHAVAIRVLRAGVSMASPEELQAMAAAYVALVNAVTQLLHHVQPQPQEATHG